MTTIKHVGIKDLKNNLSAYLRDVRRGTRILVSDRDTVVAELHEPGAAYTAPEPWDAPLADWIRSGAVVPPARKNEALPKSPVALEDGVSLRLLREDRGDDKE
jgi:antitoxin (DNA-binding transcriptional repressor) of toxin-antitoxin stability system